MRDGGRRGATETCLVGMEGRREMEDGEIDNPGGIMAENAKGSTE